MTSVNDPEIYRKRWHEHIEQIESMKQTLDPSKWEELQEHINAIHDLADDAADELEDEE